MNQIREDFGATITPQPPTESPGFGWTFYAVMVLAGLVATVVLLLHGL